MEISASTPLLFQGTINAGGTLTNEIDLADATIVGLIAVTDSVNGTLNFQTSPFSDSDSQGRALYTGLYNDDGSAVAVTAPSGTFSVSATVMAKLAGYRFVKIQSTEQTNGIRFYLPGRP